MYKFIPITDNIDRLQHLAKDALNDNYRFVERTIIQWHSNENRFDKKGEILYGIMDNGIFVGLGGLNRDPYTLEYVGRVRHVYINRAHRQHGLAKKLVLMIISKAQKEFDTIRLSTNNGIAERMYETLGFYKVVEDKATHKMTIKK